MTQFKTQKMSVLQKQHVQLLWAPSSHKSLEVTGSARAATQGPWVMICACTPFGIQSPALARLHIEYAALL